MKASLALLALPAAVGYTFATLLIKQALSRGASGAFVNLWVNVLAALLFQFMWFFDQQPVSASELWQPIGVGLLFLMGQVLTFQALSRGDLGIAAPLLGAKTIFVVLLLSLVAWEPLPGRWWIAASLCTMGIFLISGGGRRLPLDSGTKPIVILALSAAFCFAAADTFLQRWTPNLGIGLFVPIMFGTVGLCSPLYSFCFERDQLRWPPAAALAPLGLGGGLLVIQAFVLCLAIVLSQDAAAANIFYSTRAVLSVLAVAALGGWLGLREAKNSSAVFTKRLLGAIFIFSAVLLVLIH